MFPFSIQALADVMKNAKEHLSFVQLYSVHFVHQCVELTGLTIAADRYVMLLTASYL